MRVPTIESIHNKYDKESRCAWKAKTKPLTLSKLRGLKTILTNDSYECTVLGTKVRF